MLSSFLSSSSSSSTVTRALFGIAASLACASCGDSTADIEIGASASASATSASGGGGATGGGGADPAGSGGSVGVGAGGDGGGSAAAGCGGPPVSPGNVDKVVMSDGEARDYRVHIPPGYSTSKPAMLVLDFHGYLESNEDIEKISKMDAVSDAHGFITVYPQGKSNSWNAGACCGSSSSNGVKDVEFVGALLDALEAEYCVDKKRVFSVGFSNGGMLSHRLACELSDRIAAVGPVSGTMAIDSCSPTRPVPVIHFHGTSDFVVPFNGGGLGGADSVKDTIADWVKRNGCTGLPVNVYKNGDASCDEYQGCTAGSAVRLCTIDKGGHQWPGGESAGPGGNLSKDINASEEMYTFFAAHPMP